MVAAKPAKVELMEWCQANPVEDGTQPVFRTEGDGRIPTLFTTYLTLPDGRVFESGKFRKKKDSIHDAAQKALTEIKKEYGSAVSKEGDLTSPEDGWRHIVERLRDIFVDENVPRSGPIRMHMASAVMTDDVIPFSVLVACDNKLSTACRAYDLRAESDPSVAVALVQEAALSLSSMLSISEDRLGGKRITPYSAETIEFFSSVVQSCQGQRKDMETDTVVEDVCNSAPVACEDLGGDASEGGGLMFEAVMIPCSTEWDADSLYVVVRNKAYFLDVLGRELGCESARKVLISRSIGKSSSNMRLYSAMPILPSVRQPSGESEGITKSMDDPDLRGAENTGASVSAEGESSDVRQADGGDTLSKNVRASWLAGYSVYGDAILAGVGPGWDGPESWRWRWTDLTTHDYHKLMMSRNPRGMYKLSRGAVVACELPPSFTSPFSWRGKLPRQMLNEYCQQRASLTRDQPAPVYKFYVIDEDGQAVPWMEDREVQDDASLPKATVGGIHMGIEKGKEMSAVNNDPKKGEEENKGVTGTPVEKVGERRQVKQLSVEVPQSPSQEGRLKLDERMEKGLSPIKTQKGQYICRVKLPTELGGFECLSPRAFKSHRDAGHSAALGALHRIQRVFDLRALNSSADDDLPPYGGSYPWEEGYESDENKNQLRSGTPGLSMTLPPVPPRSLPPQASGTSIGTPTRMRRRPLKLDMDAFHDDDPPSLGRVPNASVRAKGDGAAAVFTSQVDAKDKSPSLPEKEVIAEGGEGEAVPSVGSMVCINYTVHELVCELPLEREEEDGWQRVVYGSSTERELVEENVDFEFELGSGAVVPPLDACVATMRKGEISRFRMELAEYWVCGHHANTIRRQQSLEKQQGMLGGLASMGRQTSLGRQSSLSRQNSLGRQGLIGRGTPKKRGKKMVECQVTLISITEPQEEKMEGALFSPPLSKQRNEFVLRLISSVDAKSMVDLGCGSGSLLEAVVASAPVPHIAGIDISAKALQRAAKMLMMKTANNAMLRTSALPESITLYEGSITEPDIRLRGLDLATCIEVIEHMDKEDLLKVGDNILGCLMPRVLVVSTPNIEFNPLLQGADVAVPLEQISAAPRRPVVGSLGTVSENSTVEVENADGRILCCDRIPESSRNGIVNVNDGGLIHGENKVVGGIGQAFSNGSFHHSSVKQRQPDVLNIPNASNDCTGKRKSGVGFKREQGEKWSCVKLRNDDHRFEWTRAEFREWAIPLAEKHGYAVCFDGVGTLNGVGDEGYATQIAIFVRGVEPSLVSGNVGVRKGTDGSNTPVVSSWGGGDGSWSGSVDHSSSWEVNAAGPTLWSGDEGCGSWGALMESGSGDPHVGSGSWTGDDRDLAFGFELKAQQPSNVIWQWP